MTKNELFRKTLERLQVVAVGEASLPEDIATVRARYDEVFEILETRDLADWDSAQEIPADAGLAMTMVLAAYSAEDFSVPDPRKSSLKTEGLLDGQSPSLAERMLKKRLSSKYITKPAQPEYF